MDQAGGCQSFNEGIVLTTDKQCGGRSEAAAHGVRQTAAGDDLENIYNGSFFTQGNLSLLLGIAVPRTGELRDFGVAWDVASRSLFLVFC